MSKQHLLLQTRNRSLRSLRRAGTGNMPWDFLPQAIRFEKSQAFLNQSGAEIPYGLTPDVSRAKMVDSGQHCILFPHISILHALLLQLDLEDLQVHKRTVIIHINDTNISSDAKNALFNAGIFTLNELENIEEFKLLRIIDGQYLQEIKSLLVDVDMLFVIFEAQRSQLFDWVKHLSVDTLHLSSRALNVLRDNHVYCLGDFVNLSVPKISGWRFAGVKVKAEICSAISSLVANQEAFLTSLDPQELADTSPDESANGIDNQSVLFDLSGSQLIDLDLSAIPLTKLNFGCRARNILYRARISNAKELVDFLSIKRDLKMIRNIGPALEQEIIDAVKQLLSEGPIETTESSEESVDTTISPQGKGFDYTTIDILRTKFSFKVINIRKWFDLSNKKFYQILGNRPRKHQDTWRGKNLEDSELSIISSLVDEKKFEYQDDVVSCCCANDRHGDLACVFVYKDDIKCFFLNELPHELQDKIVAARYHEFTQRELSGDADGKVVYVLKEPYFKPADIRKFRSCVVSRKMSTDNYSIFISGCRYFGNRYITDDILIDFLEKNMINGMVHIATTDPKNRWFISFVAWHGLTPGDLIEFFGYKKYVKPSKFS